MTNKRTHKQMKTSFMQSRRLRSKNRVSGGTRATRRVNRSVDGRMGRGVTLKKHGGHPEKKNTLCVI